MKKTILVFGIISLMLLSLVSAGFTRVGGGNLKEASTTDSPFLSKGAGVWRHARLAPVSSLCERADVDKDGRITPVDRALLTLYRGKNNCSIDNEWCNRSDITRNGKVNFMDFIKFRLAWRCH